MKTRFSQLIRFLGVLCVPNCAVSLQASAQTSAGLDIQMYAGLIINGAVGTVYAIEYAPELAQTNNWRCLAFLQLPATKYLWIDNSVSATAHRFYRAVATTPTNLVFIPPGTFRMGSPADEAERYGDEGPQTAVTLTKGFYM